MDKYFSLHDIGFYYVLDHAFDGVNYVLKDSFDLALYSIESKALLLRGTKNKNFFIGCRADNASLAISKLATVAETYEMAGVLLYEVVPLDYGNGDLFALAHTNKKNSPDYNFSATEEWIGENIKENSTIKVKNDF